MHETETETEAEAETASIGDEMDTPPAAMASSRLRLRAEVAVMGSSALETKNSFT